MANGKFIASRARPGCEDKEQILQTGRWAPHLGRRLGVVIGLPLSTGETFGAEEERAVHKRHSRKKKKAGGRREALS